MTPGATHHKATAGALRAASHLQPDSNLVAITAALIDRETGVRELLEILENIVSQAGDLIESRSPELVAQASAALRQFGDPIPRPPRIQYEGATYHVFTRGNRFGRFYSPRTR